MIKKHIPADDVGEEQLTQRQILVAAYAKLRPDSLTGMDFMGLSRDVKTQVLNDVFADAWAERENLTDVPSTVERLRKEVYKRARRARREAKKQNEAEFLCSQELFDYYVAKASASHDGILDEPETRVLTPEEIRDLWEVVRTVLKGRQMSVMEMTYAEGLTPEQIGSRLGITAGAVRNHKTRAHGKLERAKDKFARFRLPPAPGEPQEGDNE